VAVDLHPLFVLFYAASICQRQPMFGHLLDSINCCSEHWTSSKQGSRFLFLLGLSFTCTDWDCKFNYPVGRPHRASTGNEAFNINILFICCLFNDAFSVTQTIYRRMKGRQVNDELERVWKKVVVAEFKTGHYPRIRSRSVNHSAMTETSLPVRNLTTNLSGGDPTAGVTGIHM
jgi:hypothetical protein